MFIHHSTEPDLSARLLMATPKMTLQLTDVCSSGSIKLVHTFSHETSKFTMEDCIHLMDCSGDGRLAAVADHTSNIVILDLKSLKVHATLPRYKSHPTALAFNPSSDLLVVSYADHKIVEYDVIKRQYTPFSKKLSEKLPVQWLSRSCAVRHITFDVRHPDVIILHDDSVIYTIDKNKVKMGPSFNMLSSPAVGACLLAFFFWEQDKLMTAFVTVPRDPGRAVSFFYFYPLFFLLWLE